MSVHEIRPGIIGRDDIDTQRNAANFNLPGKRTQRRKVFREFYRAGKRGLTDEELEDVTGIRYTSVGPRRRELRDEGLVVLTQRSRLASTGCHQRVWRITAFGVEVVEHYRKRARANNDG